MIQAYFEGNYYWRKNHRKKAMETVLGFYESVSGQEQAFVFETAFLS